MSQDISYHPFKAFPKWHAYYVERKCAECFQVRSFPLHRKAPTVQQQQREVHDGPEN